MVYKIGEKVLVCGKSIGLIVSRDISIPNYVVLLDNQYDEKGRQARIRVYNEHLRPCTPAALALFSRK